MTVALAPNEDGINVARGNIIGRCQEISRENVKRNEAPPPSGRRR